MDAMLKMLDYQNVEITDDYLKRGFHLESVYLLSLDTDRLLAGFQETAGIRPKAIRYGGWESTEIQGHTLGHYMTALSQAWAATGRSEYLSRITYLLYHLGKCQREDGYLFASPEVLFDKVEQKQPVWVPWYTMDKILSGLNSIYRYTKNQDARTIAVRLGTWIAKRVLAWSEETRNTVLAVEYGGMNGSLYDLYHLTGEEIFAKAAHQFDEMPLFDAMYRKKDILNGLHANTTIPKILGGLKRYLYVEPKDDYYLIMAENFWNMVVKHHTYITGGNSEWEHFGMPDILDAERTPCNCETCNTYNMLKLSSLLFRITKRKIYADYDEQTFINAILSSQNSETGMTTYFQPMATGYFKVYSTPYDKFWCCTGTGMENFTKQSENIYFYSQNRLYLNRMISSVADWQEQKLTVKIEADFLKESPIKITIVNAPKEGRNCEIAVRKPYWMTEEMVPEVREGVTNHMEDEYLILSGVWEKGDCVTIPMPMYLQVHSLPDNSRTAAFTYGPFVLSADLGTECMETSVTGVDVTVPTKKIAIPECILLDDADRSTWEKNISRYLRKTEGRIEFTLEDGDGHQLVFAPHFLKNAVRYGIYFQVFQKGSEEYREYTKQWERKRKLLSSHFDVIPVGNDQYELAHQIRGVKTDTAVLDGKRGRVVKEDGWFSYKMKIADGRNGLSVTYSSEDDGKSIQIYLDDTLFVEDIVRSSREGFFEKVYELPEKCRNSTVTVKFRNKNPEEACRIFEELYIREIKEI